MQGLFRTGGIGGSSLLSGVTANLADPVLSALGGLTVGAAARFLTGLTNNQAVDTFTNTGGAVTLTNTAPASPLYNTGVINSQPALTFDGSNDRLIVSALPFNTGNSPFTVYSVFRAGTSAGTRTVYRLGGASTRRGIGLNIPSASLVLVRFEVTGDVLDVTATGATNSVWMITAMRYDQAALTLKGDVYGSVTGTGSKILAGTPNWDSSMIYNSVGQGAGTLNTGMLSGNLAELWIYNQHHSDSSRDAAVSRLRTLYNLP